MYSSLTHTLAHPSYMMKMHSKMFYATERLLNIRSCDLFYGRLQQEGKKIQNAPMFTF